MTPIRVDLFGHLRISEGEQPLASLGAKRLQSLVAYLVLAEGSPVSREHLAYLLWPGSDGGQARTNLRQLLHHIRAALPPHFSLLRSDHYDVCWQADESCWVDVSEFRKSLRRCEQAEKEGDLNDARASLERAADLYRDDLLPDLFDDWLIGTRQTLRDQLGWALGKLIELCERGGEYPAAIRYCNRLISLDSLQESGYQTLMRLHMLNQDRASSIRVYHQCMRTLRRDLGINPSQKTQEWLDQQLSADHVELARTQATNPERGDLPLVGRSIELGRLSAVWQRAATAESHLILVEGEPGIGKSRLAAEFVGQSRLTPCVSFGSARCYGGQSQLAYAPIADWLRREPIRSISKSLSQFQLTELSRVVPEVLEDGMPRATPLTESWQRRHFFESLNAVFRKSPKPLLLLIEDLQWCDNDSLQWLHTFLVSRSSAKTVVVGTIRAEEAGRGHPITSLATDLERSGKLTRVRLARLDEEESRELATQIVGRGCDETFFEEVYRTSKGNPLFLVECLRASLDGHSTASGPPPRVQAVISDRLAQLTPPTHELLGLATVVGRPFTYELLGKASDWDDDSLARAMEELWQRRIIESRGAFEFDFSHDLMREVAYAELSPILRRSGHRRMARAIEELNASDLDDVSAVLAFHSDKAGLPERAIECYRMAAAVARRRFANAEAANFIRRGLAICRDLPESIKRDKRELDLLASLGQALVSTEGYSTDEVGETYERGMLLSERMGDQSHWFSLISGVWFFKVVSGRLRDSLRLAESAFDRARGSSDPSLEMICHVLVGVSLFHLGDLSGSLDHLQRVSPAMGRLSHPALTWFAGPDVSVFCGSYLSHVLWHLGQIETSAAEGKRAICRARDLRDPFSIAIALDYGSMLSVFRGDAQEALAFSSEAAEICRKYDFAYYAAWAKMIEGWAVASLGSASKGLEIFQAGIKAFKSLGAELRMPFYHGLLAEIFELQADDGGASANMALACSFQAKNGEAWASSWLNSVEKRFKPRCEGSAGFLRP